MWKKVSKKKISCLKLSLAGCLAALVVSCSSDTLLSDLSNEQCLVTNENPVINNISYSYQPLTTNVEVTLTVDASDADGDTLTYEYTSDKGSFTGSGSETTFVCTSTVGPFNIDVSVNDSTVCGTTTQTVELPSWYNLSNFGYNVTGHNMVAHNNKIYTYGGWDGQNFQQNMYIYDPVTKTSSSGGGTTNLGRQYASMVAIGDMLYVYGGFNGATAPAPTAKSNDILIYDTINQTWNTAVTTINPPTSGRYYHTAVVYNGNMYVYGGLIDNTDPVSCPSAALPAPNTAYCTIQSDEFWEYNPATSTWTQLPGSGIVGFAQRAVLVGTDMYVYRSASAPGVSSNELHKYSFSTGIWTTLTPLSATHDAYAPSMVYLPEYPDSLFLFGGYSFDLASVNPYLDETWEYSISTDSWKQVSSGATQRYHQAAVALDGRMYVFGGLYKESGVSYYLNDMWIYDPLLDSSR